MLRPEILEKEPLTVAEVKDILKKTQKRDEELTFRGGKTQEHVNEVPTISVTKTKELKKKLLDLEIPRLKEEHVIKLIDTFPLNPDQAKIILSGFNITLTSEKLKQLVDVLDDYRPVK